MHIVLNEGQFGRIFLSENRESKNMSIARNVVRQYNRETDPMQILNAVRTDIPSSRLNQCAFLPGVVRMFMDGQINNGEVISNLNQTLKLLANAHSDEYDNNLNGLTAQELINRFQTAVRKDFEQKREANSKKTYSGNSDYKIVKIPDAKSASRYAKYVTWCICSSKVMYDNYTHDGMGIFYFLLKNGFKNVAREKGENCPLDEYGLSMIAVSINEDGSINTVTCRWNHDNGGNDNIMNDEQLSNLIGQDVYQVLKPEGVESLADNDRFRVFEKDGIIRLYDKKFDYYTEFDKYGYANFYNQRGSYQALIGKVNIKGEIIIPPKYFSIEEMESDGCFRVSLYGVGLVNTNGEEIIKPNVDDSPDYISPATPNGSRIYIDSQKSRGLMNVILGKSIKPGTYEKIDFLDKDMRYRVSDYEGNNALINEELEFDIPFGSKYEWIDLCETLDGQPVRIVCDNNDLYGLLDKNLKEILPCEYTTIDSDVSSKGMVVIKGSRKQGNKSRGILTVEKDNTSNEAYYVIQWDDGSKEKIRNLDT